MAKGYSVANLSIEIKASVDSAARAFASLRKELQVANKSVGGLSSSFKSLETTASKPFTTLSKKIKDSSKETKEQTKALQTMAGTFNSLGNSVRYALGFGSLYQTMMTLTNAFKSGLTAASDFVEAYNLFNVSMEGNTESALQYQYKLNQAFKVNMTETLRYQGFFMNLGNALGITNDAAVLMSENLTNLTLDLASLFNVPFDLAYSKLSSGMVGQTKPLRYFGVDVTQQTLQPMLYEMGINKSILELTQAEKVLLRYLAILKQTSNAQGDFARTLESPANLMRILKDQLAEMTRWFGTIFIGTLGKILPYVNATVIVLKEMFKWIAMIFGFSVDDYDYLAMQSDGVVDLQDELGNTLDASEALKKSLAGFDEINNLSDAKSGGSMPNIGYSDTYYKLLEQLTGYDNLMSKVGNESARIAENLLTWLGFTKYINEETEEVTWKLESLQIASWAIVAAFGALVALPIIGFVSNIAKLLGFTEGLKIFSGLGASLATSFGKIGLALASLNPMTIALTAVFILFVGAIIQLWRESENFRKKVGDAFKAVIDLGTTFYNTLKPYLDNIYRSFVMLWEHGIKPLWEGWVRFVEGVMLVMLALFDVLKPVFDGLAEVFGHLMGAVVTLIPVFNFLLTIILNVIGQALKGLGDALVWLADTIVWFRDNWNNIWSNIGSGFSQFLQPIVDFFSGFVRWFQDMIRGLVDSYNAISILPDITFNPPPLKDDKVVPPPKGGGGGGGNIGGGQPVYMYASGGYPTTGQMFVARESGPELVGNIGGRTAVVNNTQIVQAVASGVAQAVSSVIGGGSGQQVNIYLDDVMVGNALIDSINRATKNTGNTVLAL